MGTYTSIAESRQCFNEPANERLLVKWVSDSSIRSNITCPNQVLESEKPSTACSVSTQSISSIAGEEKVTTGSHSYKYAGDESYQSLTTTSDRNSESKRNISCTVSLLPTVVMNRKKSRKISIVEGDVVRNYAAAKKAKKTTLSADTTNSHKLPEKHLLLSQSHDDEVLSPLHSFIREQIEVFTASHKEMAQPAPGRKNPIQLNQVGLRCIHCRDLPACDRVKRAVCYPSNVGRVYNSVSDMKFDHFPHCKGLPAALKKKFLDLKDKNKEKSNKKSSSKNTGFSSSTAQYYHDSARRMGMINRPAGVFLGKDSNEGEVENMLESATVETNSSPSRVASSSEPPHTGFCFPYQLPMLGSTWSSFLGQSQNQYALAQTINLMQLQASLALLPSLGMTVETKTSMPQQTVTPPTVQPPSQVSPRSKKDTIILTTEKDSQHLNPIHCFVRRHVEFFAATDEDLSAPAPGRKTPVVLGQVGVRCIHCARLPLKIRVKRSVCYPASVGGIYHSVSNMKFDHFTKCKGLSEKDRHEFSTLRAACLRRGKDGKVPTDPVDLSISKKPGIANSTAQFYHDSAIKFGLVDSDTGIRFQTSEDENESISSATNRNLQYGSVPDGMSALIIAADVRSKLNNKSN